MVLRTVINAHKTQDYCTLTTTKHSWYCNCAHTDRGMTSHYWTIEWLSRYSDVMCWCVAGQSHDCAESGGESSREGRGLITVRLIRRRSHFTPDGKLATETFTEDNNNPLVSTTKTTADYICLSLTCDTDPFLIRKPQKSVPFVLMFIIIIVHQVYIWHSL